MAANRALIAFAFVADRLEAGGDIGDGLIPLFSPVAAKLAGKIFDPIQFAQEVSTFYGIRMHPFAAEDQVDRLVRADLLRRLVSSENVAAAYQYSAPELPPQRIEEADVTGLLVAFQSHADAVLNKLGVTIGVQTLQEAFLERLVHPHFLSIILKPPVKTAVSISSEHTLSLKPDPERLAAEQERELEAKLDVLCASFIEEVRDTDQDRFEIIVKITQGALLCEVVLNIQASGSAKDLSRLTVYLDAPFLMAALDLGDPTAKRYARELLQQLRDAKARVATFVHCIEELKVNLKGVVEKFELDHQAFGPTGRRMREPGFRAFARLVMGDPGRGLKELGVSITPELSTTGFAEFSGDEETKLARNIGRYVNERAMYRDAKSIGNVIRLRRGITAVTRDFASAGFIFVTENARLADWSLDYLVEQRILRKNEMPPCITDRYLAGLMWMAFGGRAKELSRQKLLANCSFAMAARPDVAARMQQFLEKVDPARAEYFEALMTNDRASHYFMRRTLGDARLITDENALTIYEEVFAKAGEQAAKKAVAEMERAFAEREQALTARIDTQEAEAHQRINELRDAKLQAETEALAARMDGNRRTQDLSQTLEQERRRSEAALATAQMEATERRKVERAILKQCVKEAIQEDRRFRILIAIVVGLLAVVCQIILLTFSSAWRTGFWVSTGILAILATSVVLGLLGFWSVPEYVFGNWLRARKQRAFNCKVIAFNASAALASLDVNLEKGTVIERSVADRTGLVADASLPRD